LQLARLNLKLQGLAAAEHTGGLRPTATVSAWCWVQELETFRQAHKSKWSEETQDLHHQCSFTSTVTDLTELSA